MQTEDALVRVAAECAEDLAADGVVYAEVRYAPELFSEKGLHLDAIVAAVQEGFRQGAERALEQGRRSGGDECLPEVVGGDRPYRWVPWSAARTPKTTYCIALAQWPST